MKSKSEFRREWLEANRRIKSAQVGAEYARQYRNALILESWEAGLMYKEMAEVMGVTIGYVEQLVKRAKEAS